MKTFFTGFLLIIVLVFVGCKSPGVISDMADENRIEESMFSATHDTVKVQTYTGLLPTENQIRDETVGYYAVQIGAYIDPINAERVYRIAQQRFNMEINTDYDASEELYKITVGKFQLYQQAREFCDRLMLQFPAEYNDAWVVEMTQRLRRKIQ